MQLCRAFASACAIVSALHLFALAAAAPSVIVTQPGQDSLLRTPFLNVTFGKPAHKSVAKLERDDPPVVAARMPPSPCSSSLTDVCTFRHN